MAEEVTAVLRMSKDGTTFGFLLRQIDTGEHVIYKIIENTPADMCAKVDIGDIVMKINGVDVTGLATKDVVKCVRVSPNPMTLQLKTDPKVKSRVYDMIKSTSPERMLHHQQQHLSPQTLGPEEFTVVLRRKKEDTRLGFVVRATDLLDHVIVEIREDSPAALCGKVEVGDVFLKINDTDAQQYSPRDVLKCLGLATEPITLRMKRDPWIKNYLREQYQHEEQQLLLSDESIEQQQTYPLRSDNTNGSPPQLHSVPTSRLVQPKRSKLLSLDSEPNLNSPNQVAIGRTGGNGSPYGIRECQSESACRPSRIPQAIAHNWSAPQSPSRGRKPPRASQIPTARSDLLKHSRFVMTGESQFETRYYEAPSPNAQRFSGKRKNAPLVNYDTLSSSTSRSEDNSNSSSCLMEDNANNDPTQPPSPASPLSPGGLPTSDNNVLEESGNGDGPMNKRRPADADSHGSNGNNNLPAGTESFGRMLAGSGKDKKGRISEGHGNRSNGERSGTGPGDTVAGGDGPNQIAFSNAKADSNNGDGAGVGWPTDCDSSTGVTRAAGKQDVPKQAGGESALRHPQQRHMVGLRAKGDPSEVSYSVPTSPTTFGVGPGGGGDHLLPTGNSGHEQQHRNNNDMGVNSMPTSPEYGGASGHHHHHQVFRYGAGATADHSSNGGGDGPGGGNTSSGELTANTNMSSGSGPASGMIRKCDAAGFRTSRSEDHLQQSQRDGGIGAVVSIDIDEDVNSSLNTLLDTRHDSQEYAISERERFLWSYNAQVVSKTAGTGGENIINATEPGANVVSPLSYSSSVSSSPQRSASDSPASPTSVSSSVMSSSGGSREHSHNGHGASGVASSSTANNISGMSGGTATPGSGLYQQQHHHQQHHQHLSHQQQLNQHHQQHTSGQYPGQSGYGGGRDHSVSEAVSNISSPDYQDEHDLLSTKDLMAMAISDPSDSDSTILISENTHRCDLPLGHSDREHKLVIQVKSGEGSTDVEDDYDGARCLALIKEAEQSDLDGFESTDDGMLQPGVAPLLQGLGDGTPYGGILTRESSPPVSDDGSDVDSLHSFHYSPKAVDLPSAERLAKRLYYLEGFKKSDVSRHLCKNNDFSRAVAEEYLKFFFFECLTLDKALRLFLKQFSLTGETQERERVLVHFSKRYLDCNPRSFNSQDAVHTLTCAIMLLNTDLHGQNIGSKMTCAEFIDNLSDLNDGENFPKNVLKQLYYSIKEKQLEWALDDESDPKLGIRNNDGNGNSGGVLGGGGGGGGGGGNGGSNDGGVTGGSLQGPPVGPNPFLEAPAMFAAVEYKKGYVMRKCCFDTNYKKTCCGFSCTVLAPFGRRSWKMFFCTLRDLVLYLHKDEHGFRKNQMSDNVHNAIRIHHALATRATDYTKKQHVFRLQTADQSEFLFQTSDSKELQSWIDTINFVCASFSAPPLEGGVGSQKRFQRPLLPCTHSRLLLRDQLASHERQITKIMNLLEEHKVSAAPPKGLALQNYKEKEVYLQYELKRYKTYYNLLSSRLTMEPQDFNNQHQVSAAALNDTGERRDDSCSTMLPLAGYDYSANNHPASTQQRPTATGAGLMPNFIQQHQGATPGTVGATPGRPGLSPPEQTTLGQLTRGATESTNSL
ncbi:PH and SEC7 domain-containing protein [Anopheles nili]|uniref:PH and SEC7 domain-containing protein n=1 Tax=Anopheles nili TaxID=185578 RepID=UPI00237BA5E1|nr:PH and SEC7 domain-containing protein [Anopheles nili]